MAARSSRFTHVSLGSLEDKIQLSGRQLQLLEQRRQRLDNKNNNSSSNGNNMLYNKLMSTNTTNSRLEPVKEPVGNDHRSLGLEGTETAPTTSWGSSASETSSAVASRNSGTKVSVAGSRSSAGAKEPQKAFYGQEVLRPTKERKKFYDDEGASYYESMSEASKSSIVSALSGKNLETASTALTEGLTKSSSHESSRLSEANIEPEAASEAPPAKESVHSNGTHKEIDMKAHLKKRLLANMAEKRKDQGKSVVPLTKSQDKRQSLGLNRPKNNSASDDHQRAFLRNLMQSAYRPKEEPPKPKLALPKRESAANSVTRSGTTSSSASAEDKAIMRKVLERSRKKKASSNHSRSQSFVKASTSRMKKMLTPRRSPRSQTSDESANDERSFVEPRRSLTPQKMHRSPARKAPRREKSNRSSPRLLTAVSRWSGGGSRADDEAESPKETIKRDISESSTTEDMSDSGKLSVGNLEFPSNKTAPSGEMSENAQIAVRIQRQATDVSALSRKSSVELAVETPLQRCLKESMTFDDECASNRYSIMSCPSMLNEDEVEIEVSKSHARAVTESLMEPVDLDSPKLHLTDNFKSSPKANMPPAISECAELETTVDEEEPEGYAEFVATLKAEVAGSHSLLWESFHGLFHENEAPRPLSTQTTSRFDDKTKDVVKNMSTWVKKNHPVVCTSGAQLANDKTVRENPVTTPVFGQHLLRSSKDSPHGSVNSNFDGYDSDKENGAAIMQVPSTDASSINGGGVEIEVTLGQFVRKSVSNVLEKNRPVIKPLKGVMKHNTFKPIVASQVTPQNGAMTTTDGAPWSGVKLRSVTDANKSEASNSSIPSSWAKVKLRPVSVKSEHTKKSEGLTTAEQDDEADDSSNFRRILVSKKKPAGESSAKKQTPKKTDEPDVIEIIDLANAPSTEENPIDLANVPSNEEDPIDLTTKSNEDMPIDLTCAATPKTVTDLQSRADTKATGVTIDGSVLVSLAPEPNSEPVKILIGKRGLVKIRSKPGETKARVIWRLDLEDVRSALLDLASFKVKLLLDSSDDNKDLAFSTSEQCMRFANALHEMTSAATPEDLTEAVSLAEESVFVEQLNEEEQRVLEEFRQNKKEAEALAPLFPIDTSERPMSVINASASGLSSPLSEISGPGSALSSADLRIAQSFQKMLKLGIPKEAVRHKMYKEDIDAKIVDFVLGAEGGVEASSTNEDVSGIEPLDAEEEKLAAGYKRMLAMRIPPEAVRHKMEKDGVDNKIVRAVFGEVAHEPKDASHELGSETTLSVDEENVAASYRKMLKMMIPVEAVEHKMKKDEVDPKIIAAVVGKPKPDPVPTKSSVPTLSDEEESVASSYRKQLGLRIPKEAIRQKMESEGISRKIIASVLGEQLTVEDTKKGSMKKGKQGFHWKPLEPTENLKNSVWSKASFDSGFLDDDATISSHVEQFQKKPETDDASRATVKSSSSSKDKAKLIDLTRANNLAITLKAFSEFPQQELAQIIEFVDPFAKIKGDRALFMKDLLPASAEIKVIKSYKGDEDRLVPAEKWFRQIIHIKRIEEKIHVLRTMESFRNEAIALGETFLRLANVCNQVMNSEKLPDLLEMVRQIGNRMNGDGGQEAAGFKLDFLPRLAQTKGSDKKTTALDLVVMIFNQRGHREALLLSNDFPDCFEASRMQVGELMSDVGMLSAAIRKCQKELDHLKKEAGKPSCTRSTIPSDSHSDSGVDKATANKSTRSIEDEVRTEVSNMHEELFAKRAEFIKSALNKSQPSDECSPSARQVEAHSKSPRYSSEKSYSQEGAINRIEKFIEEAQITFHELEANRDRAIAACKEFAEFFCESGGEKMAPTLLGILSEFANNLNKALQKYDHQQRAEARKKANQEKNPQNNEQVDSAKSHNKSARSSTHTEKKSLVLMVNEMLKIAGDKQKADFIKGVVYEHPDSRLQQIYEAEKALGKPIGSPATARRNILHSIEQRRHLNGPHDDSQVALSELALAMQNRTASNDSMSPSARTVDSGATESFSCSDSSAKENLELEALDETPLQSSGRKSHKMSIAERWTRKHHKEDEKTIDENLVFQVGESASQILATDSHDSEDRKYEEKKRQECISRWANQNALLKSDKTDNDLENESDVGAVMDYRNKTRQQYLSRWASKPGENTEEESLSPSPHNL